MALVYKLLDDDPDRTEEPEDEHKNAGESEEMHRLLSESAEKPQRKQIQESVHEPFNAEFALAVLALLVMDWLFSDFLETRVLCKVRNVPVHLAVNLNILYHLVFVGFQSAVHVVQTYAGDFAGGGIVKL